MKTLLWIFCLLFSSFAAMAQTKVILFNPLLNSDKEIVITNAEFSSLVGRKLIFKDLQTGIRRSIDVTAVHPDVIARLKINRDKAIAEQERIETEKKQAAEYSEQQRAMVARAAAQVRADAIAAEERALKRRELDVQEATTKVQQLRIEEDRRNREERRKAAEASKSP